MMVGLKAGLSIGGALVTWILGLFGYVNKADVAVGMEIIQPESVAIGSKMLVSVIAAVPFIIGCVLLLFYSIDKQMEVQIERDLSDRRKEK